MKDKRKLGQSQLDYLWVNYGGYEVSSTISNEPDGSIPSQSLLLELLQQLGNTSIKSISLKGNNLILYNQSGFESSRVDITELTSKGQFIQDFGQKLVSSVDIENGCPFPLYTKVYYISLNNGKQFWAMQESLKVASSQTIEMKIVEDSIVSEVKVDKNPGNVLLTTDNGLKATLPIRGLTESIKFQYLTQQEYNNLVNKKAGTIYFIDGKPYLYFGSNKIGGTTNVDLFEIVPNLPVIGEQNKIYLIEVGEQRYNAYIFVNHVAVSIGSIGDNNSLENIEKKMNNIEKSLNWANYND